MCIEWPWEVTKAGLTFGQLANVQTVGIGLYLALAVVQAVSTSGLSSLARRVTTLRKAVTSAQMAAVERAHVRRLGGDVSGLEIGFHVLNRRLLIVVFGLFTLSVSYFAYCTIWQNENAGIDGVWFIIVFYLVLPILIFLVFSLLIAIRCRAVAKDIGEMEKRVTAALLNL